MSQQHIFLNTPSRELVARPVAGPWPVYSAFRDLPEHDRWVMYESAKSYRRMLEQEGFQMAEPYDSFVKRVTDELEI